MHDDSSPRLNPFRTAPNLLTLLRICLAPFLVAAILEGRCAAELRPFRRRGLDRCAGRPLARLLKQRTMLGQYLDPVADKLLLSTLFLVLMHEGLIPTTVTVLVFGRDVGILLVSALLYAAVGRREFKPSIFGKANTLAQVSAVAAVLLHQLTGCALGGGFSHACARCHDRADRGLGAALRVGGVSPGKQSRRPTAPPQSEGASSAAVLGVVGNVLGFSGVFDLHVAELFGVKDLATLQALDIFGVFSAGRRFVP